MPNRFTPLCPLCASLRTRVFLEQASTPVHQNRLFDSEVEARSAALGDLTLAACGSCGFVFNATFDPQNVAYDERYDNSQICSPFFESYVDDLVQDMVERGVRGKRIVEIGCGKGYFLRKLIEADPGNTGVGFDTTFTGAASDIGGRLTFRREYFSHHAIAPPPDVIVCRHVIEHVPDPVAMLRSIGASLRGSSHTRLFFETPALEWILENEVVWDFFYEHCSLFTADSLAQAFHAAGFTIRRAQRVFNGQYLWMEADPGVTTMAAPGGSPIGERCLAFSTSRRELISRWRRQLEGAPSKPAVWGAGAKGVTFVNLVDPEQALIDCVVDVNPRKQGRFLAGTGHRIVAPATLRERRVTQAILLNPNYAGESRRILAELGLQLELYLAPPG